MGWNKMECGRKKKSDDRENSRDGNKMVRKEKIENKKKKKKKYRKMVKKTDKSMKLNY